MDQLLRWLGGKDLPPAGNELPPSYWLVEGLNGCPEEAVVTTRFRELLTELSKRQHELGTPDLELLEVIYRRPNPAAYQNSLLNVHAKHRKYWSQGSYIDFGRPDISALLTALMENQKDTGGCRGVWHDCIVQAKLDDPQLAVDLGLRGFALAPRRPNASEVVSVGLPTISKPWQTYFDVPMSRSWRPVLVSYIKKREVTLGS